MFRKFLPPRAALLVAAVTVLALLAFAQQTASAKTTDDQQVQNAVIPGSRLRVQVYDDGSMQPWSGHINGPGGLVLNWSAPQSFGSSSVVFDQDDLEGGAYTVVPDSPIAPGWHVASYLAKANVDPSGACFTGGQFVAKSFNSSPTVTITNQDSFWVVCVGVVPDGSIWGSKITVGVGGNPAANLGTGKIVGGGSLNVPFDLHFPGAVKSSNNVAPGYYYAVLDQPPAPGFIVAGFSTFESDAVFPTCPDDPAAYSGIGVVELTPQHPAWVICYRLIAGTFLPNSSLTLGIKTLTPDGDNSWSGAVTGPAGITWNWSSLQIGGPNYLGGRHDVPAGSYSVAAGNPVRPGWVVKGYASYETSGFLDSCPVSLAAYLPAPQPVTFSAAHANWGMCVLVEPAAPEPTPAPATPTPVISTPGPATSTPEPKFPTIDFPGLIEPASTPTPAPAKPTSTPVPTGTTAPKVPTSVPNVPTQAGPANGNEGPAQASTPAPLPPNTGSSSPGSSAGTSFTVVLGALFVLCSGLFFTARLLPGRARR